jgi:hypothetical protein
MGILGAMAGAGKALGQIADNNIEMNAKKEAFGLAQQAEIEKEKRIAEAQKTVSETEYQRKIETEGRAADRTKQDRQDQLDFNTNPDNVQKTAQATIQAAKAKDAYGDSRLGADVNREGQLADAKRDPKSPEELDYLRARTAALTNKSGGTFGLKDNIKILQDDIKSTQKSMADVSLDDGQRLRLQADLQEKIDLKDSLISKLNSTPDSEAMTGKAMDIAGIHEEKAVTPSKVKAPQTEGVASKYIDKAMEGAKDFGGKAVGLIAKAFDKSNTSIDDKYVQQAKIALKYGVSKTDKMTDMDKLLSSDVDSIRKSNASDIEKTNAIAKLIKNRASHNN